MAPPKISQTFDPQAFNQSPDLTVQLPVPMSINPNPNGEPQRIKHLSGVAYNSALYDQIRKAREKELTLTLPADIKFMAHALSGHGGTMSDSTLKLITGVSRFYSDKLLFQYALKAYEKRKSGPITANYNKEDAFTNIGLISAPNLSGIGLFDAHFYQYLFRGEPKDCELNTIYTSN